MNPFAILLSSNPTRKNEPESKSFAKQTICQNPFVPFELAKGIYGFLQPCVPHFPFTRLEPRGVSLRPGQAGVPTLGQGLNLTSSAILSPHS